MRSGNLQRIRFPLVLSSNDNSGRRLRIRIVPLDPSLHDRKSFQCGNDAVDRYLRTTAAQATRYYRAATFILATVENPSEVLGYYTLAPHEYRDGELDLATARTLKVHGLQRVPVLLLGQLGIARSYQGRGLGKLLLWSALERAFSTAANSGAVAVITDPANDSAAAYYARYGFATLHDAPFHRMLLPMKTIAAAFSHE